MARLMRYPLLLALLILGFLVGACGGESDDPGPQVTPPAGVRPAQALGPLEERLRLLAPAGFVPRSAVAGTGCDVTVDVARSAGEIVRGLRTGDYDGALGHGDATVRLIAAGAIAPLNTDLVPNYADIFEGLRDRPYNSAGGQMFALPVGRAAHMLVWRRSKVPGTLASLGAVLDPPQVASLGAQITVPDDPAVIAETALWVDRNRPDLEITDPYELDRRQFDAVLEILRLQEPYVSQYWSEPRAVVRSFRTGRAAAGLARQVAVGELQTRSGPGGPIAATRPREGSLGESPAWMLAAGARSPNCMYAFMDRVLDPAINAQIAAVNEIAPASRGACERIPQHCELYRADDEGFYQRVLFRTHPSADCGDERGRVCVAWPEWIRAWEDVTGP